MHLVGRKMRSSENASFENDLYGNVGYHRRYGGVVVCRVGLMCINPGKLRDGTRIACRLCWQCKENRINDWVGRCVAEGETSTAWHFMTLTYGRDEDGKEDHPAARFLTFSHVQKFIRLLKRHGFPCRYFAVGEYGGYKGRTHWHLLLYWLDKVPAFAGPRHGGGWEINNLTPDGHDPIRFNWQRVDKKGQPVFYKKDGDGWRKGDPAFFWPHGFAEVETGGAGAVRYCCKYVLKDVKDDDWQGHNTMSKFPPLGTEYFKREAERYVKAGLAPQDLFYSFPDVLDRKGRKIRFLLKGAAADRFLAHYVESWEGAYPGRALPNAPMLEDWMDPAKAVRYMGNGHEIRPEPERDHQFSREWDERIKTAERIEWAREHHSIGGIHNSRKYRELVDGKKA